MSWLPIYMKMSSSNMLVTLCVKKETRLLFSSNFKLTNLVILLCSTRELCHSPRHDIPSDVLKVTDSTKSIYLNFPPKLFLQIALILQSANLSVINRKFCLLKTFCRRTIWNTWMTLRMTPCFDQI